MGNKAKEYYPVDKQKFLTICKEKKISIRKLGPMINRNEKTIRRWISEKGIPINMIDQICSIYQINKEDLSDAWLFADTDNTLFYDTVTCRYFTASLLDIKAAMEELTFLNTKCGITIRTYLEELGFLNFGSGYIYDWIGWPPYEGPDKKFAELLYTVTNYGTETPQKCYMIIPTSSATDLRANK